MTPDQQWHDRRREGVGGSDVAAILGLSKFATPADVWARKLGLTPPGEGSDATRRGSTLEPVVIGLLAQRLTTHEVRPAPQFLRHPSWGRGFRLLANVDAMAWPIIDVAPASIVEAKTTVRGKWVDWHTAKTARPLDEWLLQVHHYAAVVCALSAHVACLVGPSNNPLEWATDNTTLRAWRIQISPALCVLIEQAIRRFWQHVELGTEPPSLAPDAAPIQRALAEVRAECV